MEITTDTGVDLPTEISLFGIPLHSDLDQIGNFGVYNNKETKMTYIELNRFI